MVRLSLMPTADSFILGASVSHLRMQGSEPRLTVRVDNVPQPSHRILATQEAQPQSTSTG
jgi:hypothetical protein